MTQDQDTGDEQVDDELHCGAAMEELPPPDNPLLPVRSLLNWRPDPALQAHIEDIVLKGYK